MQKEDRITHGEEVPIVRYPIFTEGGSEEETELVSKAHGVELCVHIQYQVHLEALTLTKQT